VWENVHLHTNSLAHEINKMANIIALAWIYVVFMMAITERSLIAGIMTFLMYCVLPLAIFLYLFNTPQRRKRKNQEIEVIKQKLLQDRQQRNKQIEDSNN